MKKVHATSIFQVFPEKEENEEKYVGLNENACLEDEESKYAQKGTAGLSGCCCSHLVCYASRPNFCVGRVCKWSCVYIQKKEADILT